MTKLRCPRCAGIVSGRGNAMDTHLAVCPAPTPKAEKTA
jgi:hypothetical protein